MTCVNVSPSYFSATKDRDVVVFVLVTLGLSPLMEEVTLSVQECSFYYSA